MNSIHEALQAIARAAGLPGLHRNADGVAELRLGDGSVAIYLLAVEELQIELSMRLDELRATDRTLSALLAENGRRSFGRLAVEPGGDSVVFCHRLHLAALTESRLLAEFDRFFREAAGLVRAASAGELAGDIGHTERAPGEFETFIRL